jgi:RecB family exonuclease
VITSRRTQLVRVPDLHTFRQTIADLCGRAPARPVVLVPTDGAARQLRRQTVALEGSPVDRAVVVTRDQFYDLLHARLPGAPRRLSALERDSIAQAAAHVAAQAQERLSDDRTTRGLPFRLRPGLVAEMLKFYDQLRRQSQRLERFNELIEETLGGGAGDRGTDRLLTQTRFLNDAFREYERRVAASGGWDEHTLRDHLIQHPTRPQLDHVIVTVADWIAEPDGLFIGDFDLLARMPGLQRIDLVCTEAVLGSGFHERVHSWWPELDEVNAHGGSAVRPRLAVPSDAGDALWFTRRDREDELTAIARHLRAEADRGSGLTAFDRFAVVFKRPLPYLYLAAGTFGPAGIPYQTSDSLPLAAEPVIAAVDLALDAAEADFSRDTLTALMRSPHWTPDEMLDRAAVRALDFALRERGYLGHLNRLEELANDWTDARSRGALDAALSFARALSALRTESRASVQVKRLIEFLTARLRPLEGGPADDREAGARAAVLELLSALADAHAAHHDPDWTIEDLAAAVRRWIGEQTCGAGASDLGVQLIDDRAARYGTFDDITIVGLLESEWPDRQARNIFYPAGLLRSLGWPSESTRRRAADARFLDLVASAAQRIAVSTIVLDDEAIMMRSMQLDEIARARLSTVSLSEEATPVTPDDALVAEPLRLDGFEPEPRGWAELRSRRTAGTEPVYHGLVGPRANRPWSVSALEVYLACPFKFFAQHVLKLEDEPDDAEVMDPRQQGQFMHRVFEVFFQTWQQSGRRAITPDTLDEARLVFSRVVEDELTQLPEAEAGLERTRLLGSSAAAGLGEAVLRMEAERPLPVVERLLEHRLDGNVTLTTADGPRRVALRGKADRIDLLQDGTFRLVDYKLGWPPQRARALQLPIYSLAAEQRLAGRHGRTWTLGEAAYLAFKGPKRVVPLVSAQNDRTTVLADAQERTVATLDAIERGEFPPTPDDVFLCETCSFAAICRKDYVGEV